MPRASVVLLMLLLLPSCWGGEDSVPGCDYVVAPTDCTKVSPGPFRVDFGASELEVLVGDSHRKYVMPNDHAECVESVTWTVDDPTIADIGEPATSGASYGIASAWITGLSPGVTTVRARVVFKTGTTADAQPGLLRVERNRPPRGAAILADGTAAGRQLIPFTAPRAGEVEVVVDWTPRPSNPLYSVFQGECTATPCSGRVLAQHTVNSADRKPLRTTVAVDAGPYTLSLSPAAASPAPESIRYLVHLLP